MIFKDSVEYLTQKIKKAINNLDENTVDSMIESLFESKKMFRYGVGRPGLASKGFAMRLMHLGFKICVIGETVTPPVDEGDAVILVSGSGKTTSVLKIARISKEIGARIIVITANKKSPLAEMGDVVVELKLGKKRNPRFAPLGTMFEATSSLFFDGIVAELLDRMDENEDRMTARHATLE